MPFVRARVCVCEMQMLVRQITVEQIILHETRMNKVWNILQADASVAIKVKNIKVILLIILRDLMISIQSYTQIHTDSRTHTFQNTREYKCVCICLNANRKHKTESIGKKTKQQTYIVSNRFQCGIFTLSIAKKMGKFFIRTYMIYMCESRFPFSAVVVVVVHNGNHSILCNIKCITPHEAE